MPPTTTLTHRQTEFPLEPFETLGKRLLAQTEGRCVLSLDMTLHAYHARWWDLVAIHEEVCLLAKGQVARLTKSLPHVEPKEKRQVKKEIERLRDLIGDAFAVIENHFTAANKPILEESRKFHEPDDEWFANTISDNRACEHIGNLTLRQIIHQYA